MSIVLQFYHKFDINRYNSLIIQNFHYLVDFAERKNASSIKYDYINSYNVGYIYASAVDNTFAFSCTNKSQTKSSKEMRRQRKIKWT